MNENQRGWYFLILTEDTSKSKFIERNNLRVTADSNNVAYIHKNFLDKGYKIKPVNTAGQNIDSSVKLVSMTSFDGSRDMWQFYYLTDSEISMPEITWLEPNQYKDWIVSEKAKKKRDELVSKLSY